MGEIIIMEDVFKIIVFYFPILLLNGLPHTPRDFYEQNILEGSCPILLFLCGLSAILKNTLEL
jgi:hypothetical protein